MLEVRDLAGERGLARLFAGVAFRLEPGRVLAVTGANGSGKTTLLRILAGLSSPAAGEVRFRGAPMAPFDPRLRAAVVFHGHLPALKDELTAVENLAALVALAGAQATTTELAAALDSVALTGRRMLQARVLSQGQRRRIGLARLAVLKKALWILDEPTTALDAEGTALLVRLLTAHLERGGCAVLATHQALPLPPERTASLTVAPRGS